MGGSSSFTPVILPPASGLSLQGASSVYEVLCQSAVGIALILQTWKPGCRKVARPAQVSQQGASPQLQPSSVPSVTVYKCQGSRFPTQWLSGGHCVTWDPGPVKVERRKAFVGGGSDSTQRPLEGGLQAPPTAHRDPAKDAGKAPSLLEEPMAVPGGTVPPATADQNPLPVLGNVTSHFLRD